MGEISNYFEEDHTTAYYLKALKIERPTTYIYLYIKREREANAAAQPVEENLVMQYNNPARMLKMTPSPPEPTEADVASWTPLA